MLNLIFRFFGSQSAGMGRCLRAQFSWLWLIGPAAVERSNYSVVQLGKLSGTAASIANKGRYRRMALSSDFNFLPLLLWLDVARVVPE